MGKYLKLFNTHSQYESYTADTSNFILPNVSYCKDQANVVHYNPYVPQETRVVAKFNVTSTSNPTQIGYHNDISGFSAIEVDGVELPSVVSAYTFDTVGEHIVKYTLTNVTKIANASFNACINIISVTIPNSVTSIGEEAFRYCSGMTSIDIPSSVTSIGEEAFQNCSGLTNIIIPDGITIIDRDTFQGCSSLTSVTIPNSVTSIGGGAFMNCSSLTSIDIPSGVTSIGSKIFLNCRSLTSITSNALNSPTIKSDTFYAIRRYGTLYVPIGSTGYDSWMRTYSDYLGTYGWTKVEQ